MTVSEGGAPALSVVVHTISAMEVTPPPGIVVSVNGGSARLELLRRRSVWMLGSMSALAYYS